MDILKQFNIIYLFAYIGLAIIYINNQIIYNFINIKFYNKIISNIAKAKIKIKFGEIKALIIDKINIIDKSFLYKNIIIYLNNIYNINNRNNFLFNKIPIIFIIRDFY